MRFLHLWLLALSAVLASRWSNQDYEIFDVARALEISEGANATFYSFLEIKPKASLEEIGKAYKKRSRQLHPDKNIGVKNAQKRFERLGLITKMLRTPEVRERYDHFYYNGFPKWKGTGYFYSRYRPGVGTVLVLLFFIVSGFHYLGMVIAAASHRSRIQGHIKDAHEAAGYPNLNKRKRVTTETGRVFQVDPNGDVFFVQGGEEAKMSPEAVPAASLQRSLLVQVPLALFNKTVGRILGGGVQEDNLDDEGDALTSVKKGKKKN
ncbi:DnaJ domain-containing protein [Protomyces lactucae-debilis]|uniref:DnaJ domain-containing protein n=1 Tax=Protomyces lactucae-debilis TaxID=2754530 RepID=A0A1Y2EYR6_PROLT|nr:DnaJ domain-containing protein [Protomyces lactucae-debilis]ORY76637.1 DnaJ domain-containing protein [Protomyces lactucae-debilis]